MARHLWSSGLPRRPWWAQLGRSLARASWPGWWRRLRRRPQHLGWARQKPSGERRRRFSSRVRTGHSPGVPPRRFNPRWPRSRFGRRPPRWYTAVRWLVAFAIVGVLLFAIVDWRLQPTLHQIAQAQARVLATEAVTQAVATELAQDIRWEDLYALRPDSTGRVVLVQPNTAEIDRLTSKVTIRVQDFLKKITQTQIRIPLGQVFGTDILANVGPRITTSVVPIGTVTTKILSDFEEAGINQIRHKIYLEVTAHIKIVVPLVVSTTDVTTQVPITEVLIMGDVPETYIQLQGSELRNLLQK